MCYYIEHCSFISLQRRRVKIKLFGSSSGGRHSSSKAQPAREAKSSAAVAVKPKEKAKAKPAKKAKKPHKLRRVLITFACIIALLAGLYTFVVYTNIPAIKNLREAYIETAMSTLSHHWMAELFFPQDMIDEVMGRVTDAENDQAGIISKWTDSKDNKADKELESKKDFFKLFSELDEHSFEQYVKAHPDVTKKGWDKIYINEAGIDDDGTSIETTKGDQVLAVDAENKLLLVRVKGSGYQGVLAIAKDPSLLRCCLSSHIGAYGEYLEDLVKNNDGVIGITGSGFIDENGVGSGGDLAGYTMCEGREYGTHYGYGKKRIELHSDDRLYITDAYNDVGSGTTDAVEFSPALIVDGKVLVDEMSGFTSIQPRAVLGQTRHGEILMLVIEGRLVGRSLGVGLPECTDIMVRYDAYQAMNLDGGTSAVIWYRGEYVTKCSNPQIQCRYLPNAWVYG